VFTGATVTVLRYETDRYGNRTLIDQFEIQAAFAPRTSASGRDTAELTDRAATVTTDAELYALYAVDITPQDVVRLDDESEWEVVGLPERWRSPYPGAWQAGTVIPLRRKTG